MANQYIFKPLSDTSSTTTSELIFNNSCSSAPWSRRECYSLKFRGIADEMDRDDSVDPVVGGISVQQWRARQAKKEAEDVARTQNVSILFSDCCV